MKTREHLWVLTDKKSAVISMKFRGLRGAEECDVFCLFSTREEARQCSLEGLKPVKVKLVLSE